jgi:hypothetical protein
MTGTSWQISGDYFETCSCDYLCPCITTNLAAKPTQGYCNFAMVYHINKGSYGGMTLDDLNFVVIGHTPSVMGAGDWSVGVIADERASKEQQDALVAIVSGQAGGPMAGLGSLVTKFLGVESKPIHIKRDGMSRSVSVPGLLDQGCVGVQSPVNAEEPLHIDNTLHPANAKLALAKSTGSRLHAFGIDWEDTSGNNNGHFAPFNWRG